MLVCKICESTFIPTIDKHYTSKDNGESGLSTVFKHVEGNLYDTFDCPVCGCQMIAQERKRKYVECTSVENTEESNEEKEVENNG